MAKKKKNDNDTNGNHGQKNEQEQKKKGGDGGGGGGKKEEKNNSGAVVLKVEMHCDGCASKIVRCARGFDGVESVKADSGANKLTVTGEVDPLKIRDYLHNKTKKKVDLVSPQPKKEDTTNSNNKDDKKPSNKKLDTDKKPKEAPVTTAALKLELHCQGCIEKIHKIISKTKGVQEMALDRQKETVMVKGTMDVKSLIEALEEKLKRPVEIVESKKEKEKEGSGSNKDGEKTGGKKGGADGGQGIAAASGEGGVRTEGNNVDFMVLPGFGPGYGQMGRPIFGDGYAAGPVYGDGHVGQPVYGYGHESGYGYGQVPGYPAHMQFNDENPNACSIM